MNHHLALWVACVAGLAGCVAGLPRGGDASKDPAGPHRVYIGTYTAGNSGSRGIYAFDFDPSTGRAGEPVLVAETANPAFLAIHPAGRYLYAVGEVVEYEGQKTGSVAAFSIDPSSGSLTKLNAQSSRGGAPCHLVVDPSGRNVLVANYVGGNVAALPIESDGRLGSPTGFAQHEGPSRVNARRQEAPHAHSINLGPGGDRAYAADLGADKIFIYRFDADGGTLKPNQPAYARTPAGGGPRHFAFHPSGKFAYTNNELTSSVTAFKVDKSSGGLELISTTSTLPEGRDVEGNTTAEIVVHPSGKFLYVSNRGHDSIAIFSIDRKTGRLTPSGHAPSGGKIPRNFAIDPTGRWLLAANQESANVVIFKIDRDTGALTDTGQSVSIPKPVCVRFVAR